MLRKVNTVCLHSLCDCVLLRGKFPRGGREGTALPEPPPFVRRHVIVFIDQTTFFVLQKIRSLLTPIRPCC